MHVELVIGQAEELDEHPVARTLRHGQGLREDREAEEHGTLSEGAPIPCLEAPGLLPPQQASPCSRSISGPRGHRGTRQPGAAAPPSGAACGLRTSKRRVLAVRVAHART